MKEKGSWIAGEEGNSVNVVGKEVGYRGALIYI